MKFSSGIIPDQTQSRKIGLNAVTNIFPDLFYSRGFIEIIIVCLQRDNI